MNCRCFLALLFFIKLVTAVSGTIVQADHYADRGNLPADRGNLSVYVITCFQEDLKTALICNKHKRKAFVKHMQSINLSYTLTHTHSAVKVIC
jgi:hypothetical protein